MYRVSRVFRRIGVSVNGARSTFIAVCTANERHSSAIRDAYRDVYRDTGYVSRYGQCKPDGHLSRG